ncbi:MAG: ribonuclease P protein component [Oscillospiraceae bacterium]|jgi:ribonuclease P protein component|nr:ribonuclease P protein component [Oscillospiraceae bacterium]
MKAQTINVNADFRRAYGRGKSKADAILVSYALRTRHPVARYGITTSKKIGSAVERNRCRRVIRAAYMQLLPELPRAGWDFVFVARGRTKDVKSTEILRSMRGQLKALLQNSPQSRPNAHYSGGYKQNTGTPKTANGDART